MREILFRGRDIANNWHYGDIEYFTDDFIKIVNHSNHEYGKKIENNTVGQYIGLADTKGNKIFEGDIVKFDNGTAIGFVSWNNPNFMFIIKAKRNNFIFYSEMKYFRDYEIIGNIYDNPELILEVKENA